jgi:crotonobetainyl-CoA:carnitine CoA-transferase CaiB-like acyl-CoA transferase
MLPLTGVRVIDFGLMLAVPGGAMLLGDMGAEVIKVETTQRFLTWNRGWMAHPSKEMIQNFLPYIGGFPNREPGERPWNRYPLFQSHSKNKLSMTVDVTKTEGLDIFKRLVKISDIIVENNSRDTMIKLGITYDTLKEVKEDIIYLRGSAFGDTGPYKDRRAMAMQVEALAGHDNLRGYPDMDPSGNTPVVPCDAAQAWQTAFAVIVALHYRKQSGKGQFIDLSMLENFVSLMPQDIMDYSMNGRIQKTMGNRDPSAIQGCYRCKGEDRWVNITIASEEEWQSFCRVMGNPAWSQDEKFSTPPNRYRNHDELDKHIEDWTSQHDNYAVMHMLQDQGIAAGPVLNSRDVFNDAHVRERDFFERITHEDCGTYLHPGVMFKMSKTKLSVRRGPVRLGEDNEYVYRKLLGISKKEYERLEKEGHIGMDYAPHVD